MKRRNADCGKLRRPLKRTKITENIYGSTFLYIKFLLVWSLVLLADFILEFRFEYLWPFWLLLRSVYDSFKYQGLAFSVFFVCIALTSDMICFLFIPVHWLFFIASTYVWVQYVWHTERGVCLPTISLWLLFVYIEASVRLKELKNLPFHLDLCRPFAAHCIGYPVVTLGFGFKSYIGCRMRQRKQKEVAKENHFYMQLLQQALPPEHQSITSSPDKNASLNKCADEMDGISHNNHTNINNRNASSNCNGSNKKQSSINHTTITTTTTATTTTIATTTTTTTAASTTTSSSNSNLKNCDNVVVNSNSNSKFGEIDVRENKRQSHHHQQQHHHQVLTNGHASLEKELEYMETANVSHKVRANVNDFDANDEFEHDKSFKANGVIHKINSSNGANVSFKGSWSSTQTAASVFVGNGQQSTKKNRNSSNRDNNHLNSQKDEHLFRLEADIKRLKADLQASRQCEQDLRLQMNGSIASERTAKHELTQLQETNENLQAKLHGLVTARQQDKQTICSLEKKLQEERRCRSVIESQLATERKNKKTEEAAARAVAIAAANARNDCTDSCKTHRRELETDVKILRRDLKMCEERLRQSEREAQALRQYKDTQNETEVLMSALSAMQDKNAHLENSLSAETRLKLDLFSALGEAKRQLEITQTLGLQKDKEIDDLKTKIAQVMAVMPPSSYSAVNLDVSMMSPQLYSSKFVTEDKVTSSNLDPNALVYTPKGVLSPGSPSGDL